LILPRRRIEPSEIGRILIAIILVLILAAGLVAINFLLFAKIAKGGEFFTIWSGARAFLFEHASPYSTYVPDHVQAMVYERSAGPGENPFILDIPFSILLVFFPLSLIQNTSAALVIFQLLLEITVLWFAGTCIQLANWNPKIDLRITFFVLMVLNYFTIHSILEGSLSTLVIAGVAGLLLSLRIGRDELAGALVALLAFKWQITAPILIFVVLRVIRFRMWRVAAGFAMLTFILSTISTFLYPGWTIAYLRALVNDWRADYGFSTFRSFTELFPIHGARVAWFVILLLTIMVIIEWVRAQDANDLQVAWTSCLTLAITPLLGFRLEIQELTLLLLPATLILAVVNQRWIRTGSWTAISLMITFLFISWFAFNDYFNNIRIISAHEMFLFFPILIIVGLYWVRWWAIRPPRTWLDHISKTIA